MQQLRTEVHVHFVGLIENSMQRVPFKQPFLKDSCVTRCIFIALHKIDNWPIFDQNTTKIFFYHYVYA